MTPARPIVSTSPTPSPASIHSAPSPPLSRSHPLLGSYSLSLLHSRMSHAHTPHSIPSTSTSGFSLHIGALGKGKACPPDLRCPMHENIPFEATYYDIEDAGRGATQTPWVGTIDLEQHYFSTYSASSLSTGPSTLPPMYPGYRIAPLGQLQLLIKTPTSAVRVFLVPYDLRRLPFGGRLLARERTFVGSAAGTPSLGRTPQGALRYSVQLQFICLPEPQDIELPTARDASTTRHQRVGTSASPSISPTSSHDHGHSTQKAYYLSRSIKVVFTSSPPESHEVQNTERTDEVVLPSEPWSASAHRGRRGSFTPGSVGRAEEWAVVRQKWIAKKRMAEDMDAKPNAAPRILEHPDSPPFKRASLPDRALSPDRARSPTIGFSPLPRSELELSSPNASFVNLPLLSNLSTSRPPSRSTTPTPSTAAAPVLSHTVANGSSSSTPLSSKSANVRLPLVTSKKMQRSTSREERELSEKLRSGLDVTDE